ncbi:MAG: phosphomannomutase/phosphoglucomutase [Myxococcales bacterium]|nr:phosphomannomutase/phosphoglucomutase [Myxococcales bacterium]
MNPHTFREYDIRGVADRDMPSDFVRDLGRALGTFQSRIGNRRLVLGRDCRLSSPRLHEALREGLLDAGIHLTDIGVGPTPMMYFTVFHYDLEGGVQITGSHNPPMDNGFKMMRGKASLFGPDIQTLRGMIEKQDFDLPGKGTVEELNPLPDYAAYMKKNIALAHTNVKFAVDAGNGAGGPTALAAMEAVGLKPHALLCEMDGHFPVHHPDPSMPENLELITKTVVDGGLDLGIAYDGDADRIGVIDAQGRTIWGDKLLIILARALLKKNPGAAILGEVKCSQTLYDDIAAHGGRPILWKTGHSLIKAKMKEEKALLAGEMSGHIFFADRYYGYDDAVYASLRLLEIVAESDVPLHELIADVPETFATPELRVECADEAKFAVVDRVRDHFRKSHEVVDVDGARILFEGGWGLVRASNTQPVLVLRFEANTEERLATIRKDVESIVATARA